MDAISNALYWMGDSKRGVNGETVKFIKNMNDPTVTDGWESWYVTDGNNVLEGLKLRRQAEKNIFNSGKYEYRTIIIVGGGTVTDNNGHGYIPENLGGEL